MTTLDNLQRANLIKVLKDLEYYLGVADAAKSKVAEVNNVISARRNALRSNKRIRLIILIILFVFTSNIPIMATAVSATMIFSTEQEKEDLGLIIPLFILGTIVIIVIVCIVWFLAIRFYKKKNTEEQTKSEKYISGIYAYIPFYTNIFNEYSNKASGLCSQYNIHKNLSHIDILRYVRTQLTSYPSMSLQKAVDDYYEIQHREMMLNEMQKQRSVLNEIQKENREFYSSALKEIERGNQIARDISESVDYIRYWK